MEEKLKLLERARESTYPALLKVPSLDVYIVQQQRLQRDQL